MEKSDILNEIFSLARNSSYYKASKNVEKINNNDFKQQKSEENIIFNKIHNIIELENKTESNVLSFLKYKFLNQQIYIWAGQALLAIHPYEQFDFTKKDCLEEVPSIKQIILNAIFNLENNIGRPDQCVIISGDSGSGKTFSACLAINYVAQYNKRSGENNLIWQAWSSVPLLAAFGNAPTIHNSNSSRFGKLIQMQFNKEKIVGTFLKVYLLEKSRVSGPNRGEGNFHIFTQILENYDTETLKKIYLDKNTVYKIAPKYKIQSSWLHNETLKSMSTLGIENVQEILKILSIILNLGNVEFKETDQGYKVAENSIIYFQNVCKLLACNEVELFNLFTKRLLAAKSKRCTFCFSNCVTLEECEERKNTIMRFLYDGLFNWIVKKINDRTRSKIKCSNIGILDIYGFEIFSSNTFEQLCINYTNERLHEFFVKNYVEKELEDFENKENSPTINNYKQRIEILDGAVSIFGILNEVYSLYTAHLSQPRRDECVLKRFNSDHDVALRLNNTLRRCKNFRRVKYQNVTTFSILHYTGFVEYDCKNMLEKNRDKVPDEIFAFLNNCRFGFVGEIIHKGVNDKNNTLLSKFKKSLDYLLSTLESCDAHYIKCLKPNLERIPGYFDDNLFKSQLNNNGILDILKLEMQNFPIKLTHQHFYQNHLTENLNILNKIKGNTFCGKKYIYFTYESYQNLKRIENIRNRVKARKILNVWRTFYQNKIKTNLRDHNRQKRFYFIKKHVISTTKILEVPYRFHTRKTCIPHANNLPITLLPTGLPDIL